MNTKTLDKAAIVVALLRLPEVLDRCGLSRSTIYDLISRGAFPAPVRLGTNSVAWPSNEIDAWIAARVAERDAKWVAA